MAGDHSTAYPGFTLWPTWRRRASAAARSPRTTISSRRRRTSSSPTRAIFIPGKFTARGKWMDGWESRRRRTPGHDWCVVALGMRGVVRGVNVDTSHFTGNYPSHCSIDALDTTTAGRRSDRSAVTGAPWTTILDEVRAARQQRQPVRRSSDGRPWTHLRLNIFPDGGVARLRVYGDAVIDWTRLARAAPRGRPRRASRTAASCSAPATCTSARRTT